MNPGGRTTIFIRERHGCWSGILPVYERILVAVDGSQYSMRASEWAIDLAKKDHSSLFVLSVIPSLVYSTATPPDSSAPVQDMFDRAKSDAEKFVQQVVSRAEASGIQVRGEIIENVPSVVESITDYADEWKVQVIVVGTRGLSGFKKLLLGSVSTALVSHAPCSVLIVR